MTDALRFEWVRIHTLRSTYLLVATAIVVNLTVALVAAVMTRHEAHSTDAAGVILTGGGPAAAMPFAALFLAAVGVLATGHEYRYGTIQPTLTTVPRRSMLLAAKFVSVAGTALAVTAVSVLVNIAVLRLVWGEVPGLSSAPLNAVVPGYFLLMVLWAVLGAGLALLFRSVPAAMIVLLVVPLVVEQLISNLSFVPAVHWLARVVPFLPFTAGQQLLGLGGHTPFDYLDRWASGGVFAAFVAIVTGAAWTLFTRRDA